MVHRFGAYAGCARLRQARRRGSPVLHADPPPNSLSALRTALARSISPIQAICACWPDADTSSGAARMTATTVATISRCREGRSRSSSSAPCATIEQERKSLHQHGRGARGGITDPALDPGVGVRAKCKRGGDDGEQQRQCIGARFDGRVREIPIRRQCDAGHDPRGVRPQSLADSLCISAAKTAAIADGRATTPRPGLPRSRSASGGNTAVGRGRHGRSPRTGLIERASRTPRWPSRRATTGCARSSTR